MARCPFCRTTYKPARMGQGCCLNLDCIIQAGQARKAKEAAKQAKAERAAIKVRKAKLKTRRDWINEAQRSFNQWIRQRDSGKPCICCGLPLGNASIGGGFDAGHYRSIGSAPHLRFDDRNCNGQRKQCNRYGAGRAVDYRIGLLARIGLEAVEALEADNTPAHWSIDDLKAIRDTYRAKLKDLKANE